MRNILLKVLSSEIILRPAMQLRGLYLKAFSRMISCKAANDFTYEYIEGSLSEEQLVLFNKHIRSCPMCRNFLKTYSATQIAQGHISPYEDIDAPDIAPQSLIDAIHELRQTKER